ncbi:MAG: hypothetical protein AAFY60_07785, partial [Myxococcota bacterium]
APVKQSGLLEWFSENALEEELVLADAQGIRVVPRGTRTVDGYGALRVRTDMLTDNVAARAEHLLFARGHYRYVLSFSAPRDYAEDYRPLFDVIIDSVSLTEPREVDMARREARQNPSPAATRALADALTRIGNVEEARQVLSTDSAH